MITETEGIVFRQVKTAGGRTMLLLFSQKLGKISVGTGLSDRNSKSKSSLAIRPFTYGRYELFKGRDIYNLNSGEVKKSFYSFGEDLDKYVCASYGMELTEKLIPEEVSDPRLFSLLLEFLNAMEKRKKAFDTLLIAYEVKLLSHIGIEPELDNCTVCGKEKPNIFSVREGGMICQDCAKKITENIQSKAPKRLIYDPGFDIVDTLKYFMEKPLSGFQNLALDPDNAKELQGILREYISYHMDIGSLRTESML